MDFDVLESFIRLADARSAAEVIALCEADPRMLDSAFEDYLIGAERDLREQGLDVDQFVAWRLVVRSIRQGRNLYASVQEFIEAGSARAMRNLVAAEPLLLEPSVAALFVPMVRAARQQGEAELAELLEARRGLLDRFRAHGVADGYFDILVSQLTVGDPTATAELHEHNADLAEDFQRYVHEQLQAATRLGHHDRIQRLQLAASLMSGLPRTESTADPRRLLELIMLGDLGPLRDEPELLTPPIPLMGLALLKHQINGAALDRDIVRVRRLWLMYELLQHCWERGPEAAFGDLERGELWPRPDARI